MSSRMEGVAADMISPDNAVKGSPQLRAIEQSRID
jgi:hypothetical protein